MSNDAARTAAERVAAELIEPLRGERLEHEVVTVLRRRITDILLTREREARRLALEEAEQAAHSVLAECDCTNIAARESAARHIGTIEARIRARRGGRDD